MIDGVPDRSEFHHEIELLQKLHNPYIVDYVGASHVPGKMALCIELLERGSVADLMRSVKVCVLYRCCCPF
jgi:serine/threonine protein kinase